MHEPEAFQRGILPLHVLASDPFPPCHVLCPLAWYPIRQSLQLNSSDPSFQGPTRVPSGKQASPGYLVRIRMNLTDLSLPLSLHLCVWGGGDALHHSRCALDMRW